MDGMREAIEILQSEASAYPYAVRIWMRVMAVSFFVGIVFTPWKRGARWVVSVMVVTAIGLIVGKALIPGLSREEIGTALHLSLWPIVLFVLWRPFARRERRETVKKSFDWVYQGWLVWVSVLIAVSLVLDFRAVLLSFV
jgi:hypothetical protein